MESNIILIALGAAVLGLILGLAISKAREKSNASQLTKNAKREANSIISKAKLELSFKEKFDAVVVNKTLNNAFIETETLVQNFLNN